MASTKAWPLRKKVEVEWIDSCFNRGWDSQENYEKNAGISTCRSAGYLLSRDDKQIVIVQSISNNSLSEAIAIPLVAVVKLRRLDGGLD